jgi:hypothetical protein
MRLNSSVFSLKLNDTTNSGRYITNPCLPTVHVLSTRLVVYIRASRNRFYGQLIKATTAQMTRSNAISCYHRIDQVENGKTETVWSRQFMYCRSGLPVPRQHGLQRRKHRHRSHNCCKNSSTRAFIRTVNCNRLCSVVVTVSYPESTLIGSVFSFKCCWERSTETKSWEFG